MTEVSVETCLANLRVLSFSLKFKTITLIIIYRQQTVPGVTDLHLEQIVLKVLIRSGSKAE